MVNKFINSILRHLGKVEFGEFGHQVEYDFVTIFNPPCIGIRLREEILFINQSKRSSFRAYSWNLGKVGNVAFIKNKTSIPSNEILEKYFELNCDNPYAVQHVVETIARGNAFNPNTQFPPHSFLKNKMEQEVGIERIKKAAVAGDIIFTFDRKSVVNWLIRDIDFGHWAHCGVVGTKGNLLEMVRSGGRDISLDSLKDQNLDVGLYRMREADSEYGYKMALTAENIISRKPRYSFLKVFKIFLNKKVGLKFIKHPPTLRDLLLSQSLELIEYA